MRWPQPVIFVYRACRQFARKCFLQLADPSAARSGGVRAYQMCRDREVWKAVVGGRGSADGVVGAGLDLGRTAELPTVRAIAPGAERRLAMRREHLPRKKAEGVRARHGVEIRLGRSKYCRRRRALSAIEGCLASCASKTS